MSIYTDLQKITQEVMSEFKQGTVRLVQLTYSGGTVDNPGTPTKAYTILDATVRGASYKFVNLGLAVQTDLEVVASVVDDITITKKDFIEIDGVEYKIVQDVSTPAAGTKVAWRFIVRKGG